MTKFLPENKRKAVIYILLLLLVSAGIVYVNFFRNKVPATAPPSQTLSEFEGGLLPYGSKISPRILNDEKFKILKSFEAVTVDPAALGKSNLFERQ